jgi:hypothetical protein
LIVIEIGRKRLDDDVRALQANDLQMLRRSKALFIIASSTPV